MNLFNFFKKPKSNPTFESSSIEEEINYVSNTNIIESVKRNQLEFVDASKLVFASLPIQLAKDVPINSRQKVEEKNKKFTFPLCPGMFDYSRLGYIVPAWADYHFKANKAGVVAIIGGGKKTPRFNPPAPMDSGIVDGIFEIEDGIPLKPFNLNSPWKVFSYDKDISAILLPAWYHSSPEFLENFFVYPGIVDYSTFHTMNVILAPRKKMEYTIKAGDPILHVIPFYNKEIVCGYGPPTIEQESLLSYDPTIHRTQFYRKNHAVKKSFSLEEQEKTENNKE
jgi:hypothetical protein